MDFLLTLTYNWDSAKEQMDEETKNVVMAHLMRLLVGHTEG